ncbi:hypothetical protein ABZ446_34165 [Streptomyces sp. NPDC005813]|uniref:hypothetical protein n=1 Tax=Streptomyces sp. NPDC005813 TaxID=3155592 RepID=UPI0033E35525
MLLLASYAAEECSPDEPAGETANGQRAAAHRIEHMRVKGLKALPRDQRRFTEGLQTADERPN